MIKGLKSTNFNLEEVFRSCTLVDLTHTLESSVPTWSGSCGFEHAIKMDYSEGCRVQNIKMHAGVGTHMDAPLHFIPDGLSVADIDIHQLVIPACVIDISDRNNPDYKLSVEDIISYENRFGKIPENSLVIAYTGWDQYWLDSQKYRNANSEGGVRFPGFSANSAELLLERNVVGIGIDTLSPDGSDMTFPVHHSILGAGKYIIENLGNCSQLPPRGAYVLVFPLKVKEGTESAVRAIGIMPKELK